MVAAWLGDNAQYEATCALQGSCSSNLVVNRFVRIIDELTREGPPVAGVYRSGRNHDIGAGNNAMS